MLYFLLFTSLNDESKRRQQYTNGIGKFKEVLEKMNMKNYKVVILDNYGVRNDPFLNSFGYQVFYTNNNSLRLCDGTKSYGYIQINDMFDFIKHYNIADDDFIVRLDARYVLMENNEFMNVIKNIHNTNYEAVLQYCLNVAHPVNYKTNNCASTLIGYSCKYWKQLKKPCGIECADNYVADLTDSIDPSKIYMISDLGIYLNAELYSHTNQEFVDTPVPNPKDLIQ